MKKMTSNEIRETFIEYFKEKEHTLIPRETLVIKRELQL